MHLTEIANFVAREMEGFGAEVVMVGDQGEGWERPNVLGTVKRQAPGPTLMLAAHTDVVPAYDPSLWKYLPFEAEVVDGVLHGRGSADTKSSLGAMMAALRAVIRSGVKLPGSVVLAAWAGDEWQPPGGRWFNGLSYLALEHGLRADAGIFGEPYDLRICPASRGRTWFRVEVGGEATHSATGKGINAILSALKVIDAVYDVKVGTHPLLGKDTINVGTIDGGVQPNIVPDRCVMTFDIRFAMPLSTTAIEEMVRQAVDRLRPDPQFILKELAVTERREPIEFPFDGTLVRALKRAGDAAGRPLDLGGAVSFGDVADWKDRMGLTQACLFGPGKTAQAHAINEHIAVSDLVAAARIYAAATVAFLESGGRP
jgi:acetylornithine deacetylase/succinyl-diaminopimelate desuccinylase-like protein